MQESKTLYGVFYRAVGEKKIHLDSVWDERQDAYDTVRLQNKKFLALRHFVATVIIPDTDEGF